MDPRFREDDGRPTDGVGEMGGKIGISPFSLLYQRLDQGQGVIQLMLITAAGLGKVGFAATAASSDFGDFSDDIAGIIAFGHEVGGDGGDKDGPVHADSTKDNDAALETIP